MTSTVDDGRLAGLRRRLYGLSFVDEFGPVYAVYTLWFIDNGITAAQLSTVFLVWSVVALTLEIPSGALADLVDRRRLLAAAFTIRAFGIGLWLVWPTVPGVMIGAALWAVHDSLASGAWEAMIHDQLSAVGAADRYGPMMARIGQFSHLGVAAGTVVGAALLRFDVDLVVLGWLTVAAHVGSVSLVATLPSVDSTDPPDDEAARGVASGLATADGATSGDRASGRPAMAGVRSGDGDGDGRGTGTGATSGPGSHADDAAAEHGAGWWATLTSGLGQARTEPLILRLVIVGALLEGLWLIDEYLPLVSRAQGGADATAPVLILIVWLGLLAGGEVAARRSDLRGPVLGGALVIGTGIMALALVADRVWALALVAIGYATMEATQVITDARLQERTAGEVRATVTSVRGFGSAATSMIAFVVIGALAAGDDPRPGLYVLLTALVVVALLVARWVPRRQWGAPPTVVDRTQG